MLRTNSSRRKKKKRMRRKAKQHSLHHLKSRKVRTEKSIHYKRNKVSQSNRKGSQSAITKGVLRRNKWFGFSFTKKLQHKVFDWTSIGYIFRYKEGREEEKERFTPFVIINRSSAIHHIIYTSLDKGLLANIYFVITW